MHERPVARGRLALALIRDALITVAAVLLAFAAFDDITTGRQTDVTLEYAALIACAVWALLLGIRLLRRGRRLLGAVSIIVILSALWGQHAIGPGTVPGLWLAYVLIAGALLWFTALAIALLALGWRTHPERGPVAAKS